MKNFLERPPRPRVCVIGAGASGLVAARALLRRGVATDVYETASRVGGLWRYESDGQRSAAYQSLRINTSRTQSEFSDHAFPVGTSDYPGHAEIAQYLESFAETFAILPHIRFRTSVLSVAPETLGNPYAPLRVVSQTANSSTPDVTTYDAVVVANGHHFEPSFPRDPPRSAFHGETFHTHCYRHPGYPFDLRNKKVCVVGLGNSAVDIASELTTVASRVLLSVRRGAWVLPKYMFGRPIDQGTLIPRWLPGRWRRRIATAGVRHWVGDMRDYGLPEPDHLVGEAHPTLSDQLLPLLARGAIEVRGPIVRFDGSEVTFGPKQAGAPSHTEEVDVIVYGTGYQVSFPFFTHDFISAAQNRLPLFGRVFHPEQRRVFFVGLAQTIGAIFPTAERQADWIAEHLCGTYNLPPQPEMQRLIAAQESAIALRYVGSERHTMQLDPDEFRRFLGRELVRGRARRQRAEGIAFEPSVTPPSLGEP